MQFNEILSIEGIVIRLIPKLDISFYNARHFTGKPNQRKIYISKYKREMTEETTENSLGGKYLITIQKGQGSMVSFNLKLCGIGDTIEEAYKDFKKKNNV